MSLDDAHRPPLGSGSATRSEHGQARVPRRVFPVAVLGGLVTTALPLGIVIRPVTRVNAPDDARPVDPGFFELLALPSIGILVLALVLGALCFGLLVRSGLRHAARADASPSVWRVGTVASLGWLAVFPFLGGGFSLVITVFSAGILGLLVGAAIVLFCLPGSLLATAIVIELVKRKKSRLAPRAA